MSYAIELQNCLEEAKIAAAYDSSDVKSRAREIVEAGKIAVVCYASRYCRSTDALVGEYAAGVQAFDSREEAQAHVDSQYEISWGEERFEILPKVADPEVEAFDQSLKDSDDECPF